MEEGLDVFVLSCHCSCGKLNFLPTCIFRLNTLSSACQLGCVKYNIVHFYILKLGVFTLSCHYTHVEFNFPHTCSLKLDLLYLQCHYNSFKLNFALTYSLSLDVFLFPCYSVPVKHFFFAPLQRSTGYLRSCILNPILHKPAVSSWMFFRSCHSRCVKLNFAQDCSWKLIYYPFYIILPVLNLTLPAPVVWNWMSSISCPILDLLKSILHSVIVWDLKYLLSHAILGLLNSILRTPSAQH